MGIKTTLVVALAALIVSPALVAGEGQAQPDVIDAATYQPKTEHDNTPYRFNMEQGGKRMTADEFDAWMKARGVRVAKGAPAAGAAAAPADETTLQDD